MQYQDTLAQLSFAIGAADPGVSGRFPDKRVAALDAVDRFATALPPDFFTAYRNTEPVVVKHFLLANTLFIARPACLRAPFGGDNRLLSLDEAAGATQSVYSKDFAATLRPTLQRIQEDYARCAWRDEKELAAALLRAESQQCCLPVAAYQRFQRILASKPFVRSLATIDSVPRETFFFRARCGAVATSLPASELADGARLGISALKRAELAESQALRDALYGDCADLICALTAACQPGAGESSASIAGNAPRLALLLLAEELWSALCARAAALDGPLWAEAAALPSRFQLKDRLQAAATALRTVRAASTSSRPRAHLPAMPHLPVAELGEGLPEPLEPWPGDLGDYRPWSAPIESLFTALARAGRGEPVPARNYLLVGPPGVGKTSFWRALATEAERRQRAAGDRWPLPLLFAKLTGAAALGSRFNESSLKINQQCAALVAAGHKRGFVPCLIVDEVHSYLRGHSQAKDAVETENIRLGLAFAQWMDNSERGNNLFFLCTTNDDEDLAPIFKSRFSGHILSFETPLGIVSRLLGAVTGGAPVDANPQHVEPALAAQAMTFLPINRAPASPHELLLACSGGVGLRQLESFGQDIASQRERDPTISADTLHYQLGDFLLREQPHCTDLAASQDSWRRYAATFLREHRNEAKYASAVAQAGQHFAFGTSDLAACFAEWTEKGLLVPQYRLVESTSGPHGWLALLLGPDGFWLTYGQPKQQGARQHALINIVANYAHAVKPPGPTAPLVLPLAASPFGVRRLEPRSISPQSLCQATDFSIDIGWLAAVKE